MTLQNFKAVILLIINILIQQTTPRVMWGHNINIVIFGTALYVRKNETPQRKSNHKVKFRWAELTKLLSKFVSKFRVRRPTKLSFLFRFPPGSTRLMRKSSSFWLKKSVFLWRANWVSWGLSFAGLHQISVANWISGFRSPAKIMTWPSFAYEFRPYNSSHLFLVGKS